MYSTNLRFIVRLGWVTILALTLAFPFVQTPESLNYSNLNIAAAQDDPAATIQELATRVHIQNLRTGSATRWIGGDLGNLEGIELGAPAGTILDEWQFVDLYNENTQVAVEDLDRSTIMNIWASWCGPCRFEFPFLTEFALQDSTPYDIWFVDANDTVGAAQRFLRSQESGINVYFDTDDAFIRSIGLRVFPTTIMLDSDGTLIAAHSGIVTHTVMEFFHAIAENPRVGSLDVSTIEPPTLSDLIGPIDPASATPIIFGQQVAGVITDEDWRVDYRFEGTAGQEIIINMAATEDDLDAYLILVGPDGQPVAENDDADEGTNSEIRMTLPADGTYVIIATRFLEAEGFGVGGFNLQVVADGQQPASDGIANSLQVDIPVSGRLTRDLTQQNYLISATAGETLTFALTHDLPEEQLNLQVRLGAALRLVPYTQTENGELIVEVLVEESGDYSVYVARSQSSRADPITYNLLVSSDQERTPDETVSDEGNGPPDGGGGTVLTDGTSVTGTIDDDTFEQRYSFFGNAGDVVTIEMTAETDGNLDSYLVLIDPDGNELAVNDDASITTINASITEYTLPVDGTYTIIATRYDQADGSSSGSFTLSLSGSGRDVPTDDGNTNPPSSDSTILIDGVSVTATIDDATFEQQYTFNGNAGDVVTIEMTAGNNGNLDTYLSLLGPDGSELAINDDVGISSTDSRIEFTLPETGTYTAVATRYNGAEGASAGDYTITLTGSGTGIDDRSNPPTTPTDGNVLIDGSSVTGTIDDTNFEQAYVFSGNAGDDVVIQMVAADGSTLDSALVLLGPDGTEITSNDDMSISSINSLIEFALPETGTYTIVATRYDGESGVSAGDFTLTLTGSGTAIPATDDTATPPTTADTDITYGSSVSGSIDDDTFEQRYTFNGNEGDVITIEMNADTDTELDPFIALLDPNGVEIAFNDDTNDSLNSAIVDFRLPETGTYTVIASRYNQADGLTAGSYTLSVTSGDNPVVTQPPVVDGNELTYGSSATGTISDLNYEALYTFEGTAGDVITIELTAADSDSLDTIVTLRGPNNLAIASNDDIDFVGGNYNSAIIDFTLPTTGTYTIIATRYNGEEGDGVGEFTLALTSSGDSVIDVNPEGNVLTYGSSATGTISNANYEVRYTFSGNADDVISIELTAVDTDSLDTFVALIGPDNTVVASNDDVDFANANYNSAIVDFTLPATGRYTIVATRYAGEDGNGAGDFTLTLVGSGTGVVVEPPSTSESIAYNETITGVIDSNTFEIAYTFEGEANETVTIDMRVANNDDNLDTFVILIGADGQELASNDDVDLATTNSAIIDFTLPADGTYTVIASRFDGEDGLSSGEFALTVSSDSAPPVVTTPPTGGNTTATILNFGDIATGTIDDSNLDDRYVFTGNVDDVVTVRMEATDGSLDAYISILDENGVEIAFNDDNFGIGSSKDSAILSFKLPNDGTYTIVATRYGVYYGGTSGSYELTLSINE